MLVTAVATYSSKHTCDRKKILVEKLVVLFPPEMWLSRMSLGAFSPLSLTSIKSEGTTHTSSPTKKKKKKGISHLGA